MATLEVPHGRPEIDSSRTEQLGRIGLIGGQTVEPREKPGSAYERKPFAYPGESGIGAHEAE
jgi:hypothetical protein